MQCAVYKLLLFYTLQVATIAVRVLLLIGLFQGNAGKHFQVNHDQHYNHDIIIIIVFKSSMRY